jgi:putative DNA primase/helicase
MLADTDRARDALQSIPPDLPRDEWVRAGMAFHAAGGDLDTFDQWSAQAGNYSERDARDTWRSFKPGKGLGAGTLYRMAAELGGWRMGGDSHQSKAPARPIEAPAKPRPGMAPADVWGRCEPATDSHPYIMQKQGTLEGLRVVPAGDRLTIQRESMAGALVVPVLRQDGTLSSLQFVALPDVAARLKAQGKPGKLNLPGYPVEGSFTVGELVPGGVVFVCEGIGQAWAAWKATGRAAVVCFGWGRVRAVAAELRQRDKAARLVLVPDVGKEQDAEKIAREVGAAVAAMPEGWPNNSDVNDLAQRDGFDLLEILLSEAADPPKRYKLLNSADLAALPPLQWRIRGVLPAFGLAGLYGPSASGKSFLALDMAAAIAEGRRWFDCRVEVAPVVYAALEGEAGFKLRAQAWEAHQGRTLPAGLHMVLQPFKLTEPQDVRDLAAVVPAGAVVFLDTLNRAAPLADENSSRDMGEILEAAKRLQSMAGGLVVLIHHTGKDATKGLRGHSSLFAALDTAVEVSRDGDRREWKVAKSKDGQDGDAHPFMLQIEALGFDSHGDALTSCVVLPDHAARDVRAVKLPQGGNQKVVLEVLRGMLQQAGPFNTPGAPGTCPPGRPAIELEVSLERIAERLTVAPDRKAERAREAVTGLVSRGVLGCDKGWIWLA